MSPALNSLRDFSYLGESLAVGAALVWATAVILFRISGRTVSPLGLNLFKSMLAIPLLLGTMLILGDPIFLRRPGSDYVLMLLSGIVGIGISDTLFFASLNRLGAGLAAIVACTYSPFVIASAAVFLDERMITLQFFGVALIISAVLTISRRKADGRIPRKDLLAGILFGLGATSSMAAGIMLMKPLLDEVPILWTVLVRTAGGLALLILVIFSRSNRSLIWRTSFTPGNWTAMVPGSILGGFFGFIVWTGGMKYIQASEASALNQMNTIFVFVLGAVFLREKVTPVRVTALALAVIGALLVTIP